MKQRNVFSLALINTGNLVHFALASDKFWKAIGGKISNSMDYKVGTACGQSEGLQVLGVGKAWPIYLERMVECYILHRTSSESRNIISNEKQSEVDMHRIICTNAHEIRISLESVVSEWRIP